jgi:DNA polymerase bacteriophage-type
MRLHLDYETASEVDLKKCGAYKYAAHESTRILMLGWAVDDEPVNLWIPHRESIPARLRAYMSYGDVTKHAFNAAFERLITRHCLGIEIPPEQWRCTMVEAFYLGFAGGLSAVLKAVGLEDKDDKGKRLINTFCKPAPKNHKAEWYDWTNRPEDWSLFCGYCEQDVNVERQLWHWMQQFPTIPDWDYKQWCLDQRINDRGVPMDTDMADAAIRIWEIEKNNLTEELQEITELPRVTRGPFLEWLEIHTGVKLDNLRKDYLATLLSKGLLPDHATTPVKVWAQKEGKATSKYLAVINGAGAEDRARGMFQYKGAARTDRVGGRLIQLQNLKRPFVKPEGIQPLVDAIKCVDPKFLDMLYKLSVSEILGGAIRHVIVAGEGKTFAICDLSSIESVVLGWVAQCPAIDTTFRAGRDSYKEFAVKYYEIEYDEVTKEQRGFSKPPVLGCGYMLGWKGLIAYAEGYGVDMNKEQAKTAVKTFRDMYPEIPVFWDWINCAVKQVTNTGYAISGYRLHIERDNDFLRIWLPSGRALSYFRPQVIEKVAPWRNMTKQATHEYEEYIASGWHDQMLVDAGLMHEPQLIMNFSYMGTNDKNQWVRITAHAGGITENIVQSIAGDLLWHGIVEADKASLPVILHVHDEIAVEVDKADAPYALDILQKCMTSQPEWAKDMWLGADGFITERYTKD